MNPSLVPPKFKEVGIVSNSFHKTSIALLLKPGKDITRKKLQINIPHEYRYKNCQQDTFKPSSEKYKNDGAPTQRMQKKRNVRKQIYVICYRIKGEIHTHTHT